MIGSLRALLVAFDGDEAMWKLPPSLGDIIVAGEITGDFAGLSTVSNGTSSEDAPATAIPVMVSRLQ